MRLNAFWDSSSQIQKRILLAIAMLPPPVSLDDLISFLQVGAVEALKLLGVVISKDIIIEDKQTGQGFYRFKNPKKAIDVRFFHEKTDLLKFSEELIQYVEQNHPEGIKKALTLVHLQQLSGLRKTHPDRSIQAGDYCLQYHLKEYAGNYYRQAIDTLQDRNVLSDMEKSQYIDATVGLLNSQGHTMALSDQKSIIEKPIRYANQLKDIERIVQLDLLYAKIKNESGDLKEAAACFEEAWELAKGLGNKELLKTTALMSIEPLFLEGRLSLAIERYENTIGDLEKLSSDDATLSAAATLGWCYSLCGNVARGVGLIEAVNTRAKYLLMSEKKIYTDQMHREGIRAYTNLMMVFSLLEARRIKEAEIYLDKLFKLPTAVLGHYIVAESMAALAYIKFRKGDLKGCQETQKICSHYTELKGGVYRRGSWYFEYRQGLERANLLGSEISVGQELSQILRWPDIYMRGIAYHLLARRAMDEQNSEPFIRENLNKSLNYLEKAGAKLELASTQISLARAMISKNDETPAKQILSAAWSILSNANPDLFPNELKRFIVEEHREDLLIDTIVEIGTILSDAWKDRQLLESIIDSTMRLARAERCGLFLFQENGKLDFVASRNLEPEMIQADCFSDKMAIINKVAASGRGVARSGKLDDGSFSRENSRSSWMICSPITLRERVFGTLYVDGNLSRSLSVEKDMALLRAICNHVAIALDNARAYEEIAGLKERLEEETKFYRKEAKLSFELDRMDKIIGDSSIIKALRMQMAKVAPADSPVLITGETGVGKELVARGIHRISNRREGPLIPVNTSAFSSELIASELFGHEKGAFTGAVNKKPGRFELADKGTIFFDDIENISLEIQAKLLRAIQEKEFERVGGTISIRSDFRLIAATNRPIDKMVKNGQFRSDLFFRLNIFPIFVPPLRERKDDIPLLANHFYAHFLKKKGEPEKQLKQTTIRQLMEYDWPGNVRELRAVIERMVILNEKSPRCLLALTNSLHPSDSEQYWPTLEEVERSYIVKTLEKCDWRVSGPKGAAVVLNIKPTTLYSKLKRLGIKRSVSYHEN